MSIPMFLVGIAMTGILVGQGSESGLRTNGVAGPPNVSADASVQPRETVINSFVEPATGRTIDVVRVDVPTTVSRWQTEQLTEKRIEMQWVIETQRSTQIASVPTDRVRWEPQWVGWINPHLVYVPKPLYQPTLVPVEQPIRVPKYVEVERKVAVPKLVQTTEYRSYVIHRERSSALGTASRLGTPVAPLANTVLPPSSTNIATDIGTTPLRPNPIQDAASTAIAQRNALVRPETTSWQPTFGQVASSANAWGGYARPINQPVFQLPGRPVANLFAGIQQQLTPASGAASSYGPMFSSVANGTSTQGLRSSTYPTAPSLPQMAASSTRRDVSQTGMSASVLR